MSALAISRDQLQNAIRVLNEGAEAHGPHALEDAQAITTHAARLYWRQAALTAFAAMLGAGMAPVFAQAWLSGLIGVAVGIALAMVLIEAAPLRALFAPQGLTSADVRQAFYAAHARPT